MSAAVGEPSPPFHQSQAMGRGGGRHDPGKDVFIAYWSVWAASGSRNHVVGWIEKLLCRVLLVLIMILYVLILFIYVHERWFWEVE